MNEEKIEQKTEIGKGGNAGLFIPAGIFLGLAYGSYIGNLPFGFFVGIGTGFLLFAITSFYYRSN